MNKGTKCTVDSAHEIIEKYASLVYRLAYAKCRNKADAEDVFQDVFVKLFSGNHSFDSDEHLKNWLIRTTIHTSINLFKSAWRRYMISTERLPELSNFEDRLTSRQILLRDALRKLPERDRLTLYLYYYEELSTHEISEADEEKPATTRSRLARSRNKL